jgi:hypothetical protein
VIGVFNNYSNLPTGRVFVPLPGGTTSFSRRKRKQNGSALNIYAVFYAPGFAGAQSTPHRLRRFADCFAQANPAKTFLLKTTHKSSRPLPLKRQNHAAYHIYSSLSRIYKSLISQFQLRIHYFKNQSYFKFKTVS